MDVSRESNTGDTEARNDIYEVQEIVGMRTEGDETVYRVRWKGYNSQSDTWEPESNLRNVWKMVEKYRSKINIKMPLVYSTRRRGRPSAAAAAGAHISPQGSRRCNEKVNSAGSASAGAVGISVDCGVVVKHKQLVMNGLKCEKSFTKTNAKKKPNKKRLKYIFTAEKSKDTFWKDLEEGRIDVFKEDLYSRVKSRASSRGNSGENSPKTSANSPKEEPTDGWPEDSAGTGDDSGSQTTAGDFMSGELRLKHCKTEALMAAIRDGDKELVRILIRNGSDINGTFGNANESTPLMVCCEENNVVMTQFLLSNGALKDVQNRCGDTALIIACRLGFEDIIKFLLIFGSNFAIINSAGMNALRITRIADKTSVQEILFEHISKLALSLEVQVLNMLCNTASIVNALFPIQCHSVNESKPFRLKFEFDVVDRHLRRPGVGYILFVANTCISETDIRCEFSGPNIVEEVLLNGIAQKPLTEGAQFVFSFDPLWRGSNELVLKTVEAREGNSHIKLLVCAYRLQLIGADINGLNIC